MQQVPSGQQEHPMTKLAVVFHSGYGHTRRVAEAVLAGAAGVAGTEAHSIAIEAEGDLPAGGWEALAAADAIVFGSPTYMGNVSWQFKRFADASSKPWYGQAWKDKLAAGFTNSASINGDKGSTIAYLVTLAMQHGMLWVGTGLMPSNAKAAGRNDVNWLAGSTGALAQSPSDASVEEMLPGDLETARLFGARVATQAQRLFG
jgi:NAD(P)H dehydrogenase (quinone)